MRPDAAPVPAALPAAHSPGSSPSGPPARPVPHLPRALHTDIRPGHDHRDSLALAHRPSHPSRMSAPTPSRTFP
jgi:hypothetical protein